MPLPILNINKNWYTATTVQEGNWDNIRGPLLDWASKVNLAFQQITLDTFGSYNINNAGTPTLALSLQDQINAILSGGAGITGTISATFTIHQGSAGNAILSTTGLTGARTFTFPDATQTLVGTTAVQTLSNKTFNGGAGSLPPVGSIIPHYDFAGTVTIDTAYWVYCDGSVISNGSSPINGLTLPDLSGRYLVGFGTDGGGDIDTAIWGTGAVGNAAHQVNLQHSHTVNAHSHDLANHVHAGGSHTHNIASHNHDMQNHTHSVGPHTHGPGTLQFQIGDYTNGLTETLSFFDSSGTSIIVASSGNTPGGAGAVYESNNTQPSFSMWTTTAGATGTSGSGSGSTDVPSTNTTSSVSLVTDPSGTGNTGVPVPNLSGSTSTATDNQLSTTQSIQPRSIRVRYIMRIV